MIMGALMCVLYMGVAAEPNLDETPSTSVEENTGSGEEGNESSNTISVEISVEGSSSEETNSDEDISSQEVSSEDVSSTATSSRYGANATDPTIGNTDGNFGGPESDTTIEFASKPVVSDDGSEKNIFNLSKVLKGLIFIPIVLALAAIGALIYVNRKEFAGAKTKKADKQSGSKARKKNNK